MCKAEGQVTAVRQLCNSTGPARLCACAGHPCREFAGRVVAAVDTPEEDLVRVASFSVTAQLLRRRRVPRVR